MILNNSNCYHAYVANDSRFDRIFCVGVTSTGIYCRAICIAKTPKETHGLFFKTAVGGR